MIGLTGLISAGQASAQPAPPVGTELAQLQGSGTAPCDAFGGDVAVSGNTAVVGAYGYGGACDGIFPGGAFVFTKTTTGWKQTAVLQASNQGPEDWFGSSVAISGNTIVVGSPNKDQPAQPAYPGWLGPDGAGRVYVFTKTGVGWQQTAELKGSDTVAEDMFGGWVGASGNTIVVDSSNQAAGPSNGYVFTKAAAGWRQTAEFKNGSIDVISGDRMVATCGPSSNQQSCVYADTAIGWLPTGVLPIPVGENCGPTALYGSTIVCVDSYTNGSYAGTAYVFTKTSGGWVQTAQLSPTDSAPKNYFGVSAAISGNTIAIGADEMPPYNGHQAGHLYFFTLTNGQWHQSAEIRGSAASNESLGYSLAMSGTTLVTGAAGYDKLTGLAYVFQG